MEYIDYELGSEDSIYELSENELSENEKDINNNIIEGSDEENYD